MKDLAGSNFKNALKVNFRTKDQKIKGFIGSDSDPTDVLRFKARSSAINIQARGLGDTETLSLYKVKKKIGKTLRKIGQSDFLDLTAKKRKRFLTALDLDSAVSNKKTTYSAEVEKGTYFLVVSSASDTSNKYTLKLGADKIVTDPTDPTTIPTDTTGTTDPTTPTDTTNPTTTPTDTTDPTTPTNTTDTIGNTILTAQSLTLGSNPSETVGGNDDSDVFTFTLSDRQKVSLDLSGLSQNSDLALLDSSGNDIKISAASGTNTESIVKNLDKGTYYIKVSSDSTTATNYTLTTAGANLTQTALFTAGNDAVPDDQGQLALNQIPFTTDVIDQVVAGATVNGFSVAGSNTVKSYLLNNYSAAPASETGGSNGVTLNTQLDGAATNNTGYVGYTNYSPDYDNVSVTVDSGEAFLWLSTGVEPSSIEYNADLVPVAASLPTLDSEVGYIVSFDLSLETETSDPNRAGFSIVVVSNDGTSAIELGFKSDRIFAQSATFQEAETYAGSSFALNTMVSYELHVSGSGYELFADGSSILAGDMRSYSFDPATSEPVLPVNPYTTKNLLFFGDNTDQGRATFTLGDINLFT